MRIIDCYYIKGSGKDSKCYKIHGVGVGYNIGKSYLFGKGITIAGNILSVSPLIVAVGISVIGGFVKKI